MPWLDACYLAGMVGSLALAASVLRRPVAAKGGRFACAAALTVGWVGLGLIVAVREPAVDYTIFWLAGRDVLEGRDPYVTSVAENRPFFNPPTALTLFAGLALVDLRTSFFAWEVFNILAGLALVPLAVRAVGDRAGEATLTRGDLLAFTAAFGFCNAYRSNLLLGQMAVLTALALAVTAWAWHSRRPLVSAAGLVVGSVKVGTTLPFCLLFHRRGDWRVWAVAVLLAAVVCGTTTPPAEILTRCRQLVSNIGRYSSEGYINDYSNAGPHSADIIGYDKVLYHAGVRDRASVRIGQSLILGILGVWLAREIVFRGLHPGAAVSLVSLYAVVFLYHRNYDTVLLILPLVYATARLRTARGLSRFCYAAAGACVLAVMYMPRKLLFELVHSSTLAVPAGWPIRFVLFPVSTWLITAAFVLLWCASRKGCESVKRE